MKHSLSIKAVLAAAILVVSGAAMGQSSEQFSASQPYVSTASPLPNDPNGVALSPVIVSGGEFVTSVGTAPGGADESILQNTTLGLTTLGSAHQFNPGTFRVADEFTMPGEGRVEQVTFYAYQTGSTTTSTMTGVYLRIWDGVPGAAGSNVIFGDHTTNRMIDTRWTGAYRVAESTPGDTNRPIMANTASVGIDLQPGVYWLDWMTDGTLGSGPWAPPVTITGQAVTGNALQSVDSGVTYPPLTDGGSGDAQGLPFAVRGSLVPQIIPSLNVIGMSLLGLLMIAVMVVVRRRANAV